MLRAIDGNWQIIQNFSKSEFPAGVLEHMSFSTITRLQEVRLMSGQRLAPSPIAEAHVRHDNSNSLHSTKNKTRLSKAIDFFCLDNQFKVFEACVANAKIGGIGVYLDTQLNGKSTVMFHIDERPERLMWVRVNKDYYYNVNDYKKFYELISKM